MMIQYILSIHKLYIILNLILFIAEYSYVYTAT